MSTTRIAGITQSTSISIAVVFAITSVAFWTGSVTQELQSHVDALETGSAELAREDDKHEQLMQKLTELSTDNKHRLDLLQQRIDAKP